MSTVVEVQGGTRELSESGIGQAGRLVAFSLPILAVVGSYAPSLAFLGGQIFLFRVIAGCVFAAGVLALRHTSSIDKSHGRIARTTLRLAYVWVSWGLALTFFVSDRGAAFLELLIVLLSLGLALSLIGIGAGSENGIRALRLGWVAAYCVAGSVALWEIQTGHHLTSSFTIDTPSYVLRDGITIQSTLGNPNDYAAFILLCFPFLAWTVLLTGGLRRLACIGLVISAPILVILSGSGIAMVGLLAEAVVLLLLRLRRRGRLVVFALCTLVLYVLLGALAPIDPFLVGSHVASVSTQQVGSADSLAVRINLTRDGIWMTTRSYGVGLGPASFADEITSGDKPFPTAGIVDPHDFWIEVLAQYGVVVFVLFMAWLGQMVRAGWKVRRSRHSSIPLTGEILIVALSGYVLAAVANSSFLESSINWMFLATAATMTAFLQSADQSLPSRGGSGALPSVGADFAARHG
jgi:hypothetical protein